VHCRKERKEGGRIDCAIHPRADVCVCVCECEFAPLTFMFFCFSPLLFLHRSATHALYTAHVWRESVKDGGTKKSTVSCTSTYPSHQCLAPPSPQQQQQQSQLVQ
jgi:hypothetical protein